VGATVGAGAGVAVGCGADVGAGAVVATGDVIDVATGAIVAAGAVVDVGACVLVWGVGVLVLTLEGVIVIGWRCGVGPYTSRAYK
jgi:hypothetical protein